MSRRSTVVASVTVDRPSSEVFAYLADVARHGEWSPKAYRVEGIEPGRPVEEGARWTSYGWMPNDKDHRNEVEATSVEAPHRLVLTAVDGGERYVSTFTLTAQGSRTVLERSVDLARPGGLAGMAFPLIAAFLIKPDVARGLGRLKTQVEGRV